MHKRGIRTKILSVLAAGALLFPAATSCSQKGGESLVLDSEDDLSGLTVSCSAGSYYERKFTSRGDVNVFACNSEADALQAMRQGLADVFVSDEVMLTEEMMERLGVKLALRGSESFPVAFALRKGNDKLKDELNRFLAEAPIDEIFSSWLHGTEAPPFEGKEIDAAAEPLHHAKRDGLVDAGQVGAGARDRLRAVEAPLVQLERPRDARFVGALRRILDGQARIHVYYQVGCLGAHGEHVAQIRCGNARELAKRL